MSHDEERSEDIQAFVDAFKKDCAIEPDVDAAWARLEHGGLAAQPAQRRVAWWAGVVVMAAAAAAALWWGRPSAQDEVGVDRAAQQAVDQALENEHAGAAVPLPTEPASPRRVQPPGSRGRDAAQPAPPAAEAALAGPEALSPSSPSDVDAPKGYQPRSRRRRVQAQPPEPEVEGPTDLARELELVKKIRKASKSGLHTAALALVRQHADEHQSGVFAAERELTRVRSLCKLGKQRQAKEAREGFERAFPNSHLAPLVASACDGID